MFEALLQGGDLRGLHDRRAEARPEGVRVDALQKQGGVGEQYKVNYCAVKNKKRCSRQIVVRYQLNV